MYKFNQDKTQVIEISTGTFIPLPAGGEAGGRYQAWLDAGNTTASADPLPPPVYYCSPWQIRKALIQLGLRQTVEAAVAASTDIVIKDGWEFATEFRSDDPFVVSMGASIGMTAEETAQVIQLASTM